MNKKILIIFLCVLVFGLIACSMESQERSQNEEKAKKLAENLGTDPKEAEENIKKMSDKELADATKFVNEDGTLDIGSAMQEGMEESSKKQEQESNKLPLKEISANCELFQDPASKKYTKTLINLNGCADDGKTDSDSSFFNLCESKSNLKGNINIKIYGLREKESKEFSFLKEFEKGKLLIEFNGAIDSIMSIKKSGSILGSSIVYQTEIIPQKIVRSNIEYWTQDKEEDEYGRKYARVPFVINAKFVDNNGKEYLYNDKVKINSGCEVLGEVTS